MKCKVFEITVELEVQAITCPGVWLCPNGKVTLQIYMLGCCTQTSPTCPVFPLIIHEKFKFNKIFHQIRSLHDLENVLNKEELYAELIQWETHTSGNVLATFKTSLAELLYPPPYVKGLATGEVIDLLMEGTRRFPGIIAPKIEASTRTTIEEILCCIDPRFPGKIITPSPKVISSKWATKKSYPMRQKKVCHSYDYHKKHGKKPKSKTQYDIQISEEDILPSIKPKFDTTYYEEKCVPCETKTVKSVICIDDASKKCPEKRTICKICAKYKEYFNDNTICPCGKAFHDAKLYAYENSARNRQPCKRCNPSRTASGNYEVPYVDSKIHNRIKRILAEEFCLCDELDHFYHRSHSSKSKNCQCATTCTGCAPCGHRC